jgi:glyoxylase-like metal-dependent hydrolase (beta-lactamase superfamily II)
VNRSDVTTPISRRDALKWTAASAAAGALSLQGVAPARADIAQAAASQQGAGFYKTAVGDVELIIVSDGGFMFNPPEAIFTGNVGKEAVHQALAEEFILPGDVVSHVNTLLIRTKQDLILVDTGCGSSMGPNAGKLSQNLASAGIKPGDITAVLLTHAHPDHLGGLVGEDLFPNAERLVSRTEFDFWTADNPDFGKLALPAEAKAGMARAAAGVLKKGNWTTFESEQEIRPKVRAVPAPGHTPGHTTLLIDGGGNNQLHYITDAAIHYAINLPHPDYHVAFDRDPVQASQTRRQLLDRAAADKLLVSGAHLPFPAVGHVKKQGEGFAWVPAVWKW